MSRCSSRKRRGRPRQPKEQRRRRVPQKVKPKRQPLKVPPPVAPRAKTTSNIVWENIVLHYLNKLKNAWKSKPNQTSELKDDLPNLPGSSNMDLGKIPCGRRKSTVSALKCPPNSLDQSKSQNSLISLGSDSYNMAKRKAINIVRHAIEYGQSKGIISKNGKFFWLKDEVIPLTGPDEIPCNACPLTPSNSNKKLPEKPDAKSNCSSTSVSSTPSKGSSKDTESRNRNYDKAKSIHPNLLAKKKMRSHFSEDGDDSEECTCNRCRMYH